MGGGGNDNYEAKAQAIEDKKQAAREKLNYMFGVGDGGAGRSVDKAKYTRTITPSYQPGVESVVGGLGENTGAGAAGIPVAAPGTPGWMPAQNEENTGGSGTGNSMGLPFQQLDQAAYDAEAQRAAQEAEANNPNRGARDTLYQTVRDTAFNAGKRRLDEANQEAARKLKFELFARGLNGGSADVDENANRQRTYTGGLVDLGGKADAAKADFRQGDETTRLNLLQSIDAGMDQGSALSSAISQMGVNADKASSEAVGTDLGNLFNTGAEFYNQSQYAKGKQAGTNSWDMFQQRGNPGASGKASNVARYGQITNVG